jgi:ABC-type Zn uptake system ZnuABC Zn-binding protein ZnuA
MGVVSDTAQTSNDKPNVLATTTIVGDVVQQVGGDAINLTVLLPVGADPHGFDPAPADAAAIADADLVFVNGLGLEEFLEPLLANASDSTPVVAVSDGIQTTALANGHDHGDESDHEHADEAEHEPVEKADEGDGGDDPHVWTNPVNVTIWAQNIARALSEVDPEHAETYTNNALDYAAELAELDAWVQGKVEEIPEDKRLLITDHAIFSYFAQRYGIEQVGTVLPGFSTLAEPSAQEVARLEDTIRDLEVRAVFVGNTANPALAKRIADDTGIQIVTLYTGSLSEADGEAPTYLDYMRYNVTAITEALTQ